MDRSDAQTIERRLGGALEPVIGQVYFSPEAHRAYAELGFAPSSGDVDGVAMPDGPAYFTSRGSLLGNVRGMVVASAFAVFKPEVLAPAVEYGWTLTDASTICGARDRGALDQLERILGPDPSGRARVEQLLVRATDGLSVEGRPLAAGISAIEPLDHPYGVIFRQGDLLREYRGDSHTIAWAGRGLSGCEIGLLTELYWGLPSRSYARTRGWTDTDFDNAQEAMRSRGLLTGDGTFTSAGSELREQIEVDTDAQMAGVLSALGDDAAEAISILAGWGVLVREAKGYLSSGPHELAARGQAL